MPGRPQKAHPGGRAQPTASTEAARESNEQWESHFVALSLSPRSISDNEAAAAKSYVGAKLVRALSFLRCRCRQRCRLFHIESKSDQRCVESEIGRVSSVSLSWVSAAVAAALHSLPSAAASAPSLSLSSNVCKPARQLSLRSSAVAASPSWGKMLQGFVSG